MSSCSRISGDNSLNVFCYNNNFNDNDSLVAYTKFSDGEDCNSSILLPLSWDQRAIKKLESWDKQYIEAIPNILRTTLLDNLGHKAEHIFNTLLEALSLDKLNRWLNTQENFTDKDFKGVLKELAVFLAKLPLRAVHNILNMIVNIVKTAVTSIVHPAEAIAKLAKSIVRLLKELTKPETWTKIGAGMIGASLGQAALGNPLTPIGIIIGAAMMCGGLAVGALVAALRNEKGERVSAVKNELIKQFQAIPEAMLTGFIFGLMFGAIQRHEKNQFAKSDKADIENLRSWCKETGQDFEGVKAWMLETAKSRNWNYVIASVGDRQVASLVLRHFPNPIVTGGVVPLAASNQAISSIKI